MAERYAEPKKFNYHGKESSFFELQLSNWVLVVLTFGLYYPWVKASTLRYRYQKTELAGSRFVFNGTGKELMKSYLKVGAAFSLLLVVLLLGIFSEYKPVMVLGTGIFCLNSICLVPVLMHNKIRYRASRSSWRGVYFSYRGTLKQMFRLFIKNLFYTIITFGLYGPWFVVAMRREIIGNLRLGKVRFSYEGQGRDLFKIIAKGFVLTILTAGIYLFVLMRDLHHYYVNNIYVKYNGQYARFNSTVSGWELFKLYGVNFLLVVFSFGIASPVAMVRTLRYITTHLELVGIYHHANSYSSQRSYGNANYAEVADMLDINAV